jgi:hypothetical protein
VGLSSRTFTYTPRTKIRQRAHVVKEGSQPTHTLTSYYRPDHVEGARIVDPTLGPAGRGGGFRVLYAPYTRHPPCRLIRE